MNKTDETLQESPKRTRKGYHKTGKEWKADHEARFLYAHAEVTTVSRPMDSSFLEWSYRVFITPEYVEKYNIPRELRSYRLKLRATEFKRGTVPEEGDTVVLRLRETKNHKGWNAQHTPIILSVVDEED